jgi:hypothetical protein
MLISVDNGSYISIYVYVMKNWMRIPMMINLQRIVDGSNANKFNVVIMEVLQNGGGLTLDVIAQRLLCLGAGGINTF